MSGGRSWQKTFQQTSDGNFNNMANSTKKHNPIYAIQLTNHLTSEKAEINRFQSERFVFTVQTESVICKTFQIIFGKSDGSLYVSFPYFDIAQGLVSIGTIPKFLKSTDINLKIGGKVTLKRVKYAHHPDGEVHFSQTGKVSTSIRRRSIPLVHAEGHLFTISLQGLSHFEKDITNTDYQPKLSKTILNFKFENEEPSAIKFVARWYKSDTLLNQSVGHKLGPIMTTETPEGKRSLAFLIGPPEGWPNDKHIMLINCEKIPLLDKDTEASFVFIGGFDPREIHDDISQPSSFLCVSYPISNYEDLIKQIGSIDLDI